MKTTPPFISEVVREYNEYVISIFDMYDPNVSDYMRDEFLREKLTAVYERGRVDGRQEGREDLAKEIAMAGENKITLLDNAENFTGTYWISLNSLYFHLTGRHLNADWENGVIEKNPTIEALIRKEAALTTEGK